MPTVNFGEQLPSQVGYDYGEEERRKRLAQALQEQSLQPLQTNVMAGRRVVPISWTQGLAKVLGAGIGKYKEDQAVAEQKRLIGEREAEQRNAFAEALRMARGQPGGTVRADDLAGEAEGATTTQTTPAVAPDPIGALGRLSQSTDPALRQMGMQGALARAIPAPMQPFTLKAGDTRYGANGEIIAQSPMAPGGIAKLDPGKYTEESIAKYQETGNPWDLRPRATPGQELSYSAQQARLAQLKHQFDNLSANQLAQLQAEAAKYGKSAQELFFQTGMQAPAFPMAPQFNPSPPMPQRNQVPGAPAPIQVPQVAGPAAPSGVPAPVRDNQAPSEAAAIDAITRNMQQGGRGGSIYLAPEAGAAAPKGAPISVPGAPSTATGGVAADMGVPALSPKQIQKRELDRPVERHRLDQIKRDMEQPIKAIDRLLDDKSGLKWATGTVAGALPSIRQNTVDAEADIQGLKDQISLQVIEQMRAMSKTGGAVGNMTEKEWPILQNKITSLNTRQGTEKFRAQLLDIKRYMQDFADRAERRYKETYPERRAADNGGASNIDALLNKYNK